MNKEIIMNQLKNDPLPFRTYHLMRRVGFSNQTRKVTNIV